MKLKFIYRHPVKGLRPESLSKTFLKPGDGIPFDRAFAFLWDDDTLPDDLKLVNRREISHISKKNLIQQHDWPAIARWSARVVEDDGKKDEDGSGTISVFDENQRLVANLLNDKDATSVTEKVVEFIKDQKAYLKAYHPTNTKITLLGQGNRDARFTDRSKCKVSVGFLSSLEDFSRKLNFKLDPRRFRLNLWVDGGSAWDEMKYDGRTLKIGQVTLKLSKPIGRCANINVDPDAGISNTNAFENMNLFFGHGAFGITAEVIEGGCVTIEDGAELI